MLSTTVVTLKDPEKLMERISEQGLSLRRLADEVNVTYSRIGQLSRGHKPSTSAAIAVAIAAALDVDVAELFEFPDGEALLRLGLI